MGDTPQSRVLGVSRLKIFDQLSIVYDVVFAGEFKYVLEIFVTFILFLEIEVKVVKKTEISDLITYDR